MPLTSNNLSIFYNPALECAPVLKEALPSDTKKPLNQVLNGSEHENNLFVLKNRMTYLMNI